MANKEIPVTDSSSFVTIDSNDPDYNGGALPIMNFDGVPHFPAHNFLVGNMKKPDGGVCVLVTLTSNYVGLNMAMAPAAARVMAAGLIRVAEALEADADAEAKAAIDRIKEGKPDAE